MPSAPAPAPWTSDDTEEWLKHNPLPGDFRYPGHEKDRDGKRIWATVLPTYQIKHGYGFWLRTTPYFPGLFEEIHAILAPWPENEPMPAPEALGAILHAREADRTRTLFDLPTP